MAHRYDNETVFANVNEKFKKVFLKKRGIKQIVYYGTPIMYHADIDDINTLSNSTHIWKLGDRFFKLAHKHYNDSRYWWLIAWYNQKPTESHVMTGEIIYIPTPVERALEIYMGL